MSCVMLTACSNSSLLNDDLMTGENASKNANQSQKVAQTLPVVDVFFGIKYLDPPYNTNAKGYYVQLIKQNTQVLGETFYLYEGEVAYGCESNDCPELADIKLISDYYTYYNAWNYFVTYNDGNYPIWAENFSTNNNFLREQVFPSEFTSIMQYFALGGITFKVLDSGANLNSTSDDHLYSFEIDCSEIATYPFEEPTAIYSTAKNEYHFYLTGNLIGTLE